MVPFENEDDRASLSKHYRPTVRTKYYNAVIDGKGVFDVSIKNKEEAFEKNIEMGRNNDCTIGNSLDMEYF